LIIGGGPAGLTAAYELSKENIDSTVFEKEKIAFYSTLLFITPPWIVEWIRSVMLEIPSLSMIIMSVHFFYNFIELGYMNNI